MDNATAAFMEGFKEPIVPDMSFEEYSEAFKDAFILTRKNGICEIRMHTKHGSAVFGKSKHHGWSQILKHVGADPENEVIIITGTGDEFVAQVPPGVIELSEMQSKRAPKKIRLEQDLMKCELHREGTDFIRAVVENLHVPTIGAVNGPAGTMSALALLCDVTICSDRATFMEEHFIQGLAPADGNFQVFQGLTGIKRTAYMCYTDQIIDAKTALDWGMVNEVVPHGELHDRAWALAEQFMRSDKYARYATHAIFQRYYKEFLKNFDLEFGMEAFCQFLRLSNSELKELEIKSE